MGQVRSEFIDLGVIGTNIVFKVIELDEVAYKGDRHKGKSSYLRRQMNGIQGTIISMQKVGLKKRKGKQ